MPASQRGQIRERDLDAKDELLLTSHPFFLIFMARGYSQDATARNSASGFLQEERPLRLAPRGSRLAFVRSTSHLAMRPPAEQDRLMASVETLVPDDPGAIRWAGPPVGAHNEEVFSGLLGLSSTELAALRQEGVC